MRVRTELSSTAWVAVGLAIAIASCALPSATLVDGASTASGGAGAQSSTTDSSGGAGGSAGATTTTTGAGGGVWEFVGSHTISNPEPATQSSLDLPATNLLDGDLLIAACAYDKPSTITAPGLTSVGGVMDVSGYDVAAFWGAYRSGDLPLQVTFTPGVASDCVLHAYRGAPAAAPALIESTFGAGGSLTCGPIGPFTGLAFFFLTTQGDLSVPLTAPGFEVREEAGLGTISGDQAHTMGVATFQVSGFVNSNPGCLMLGFAQ